MIGSMIVKWLLVTLMAMWTLSTIAVIGKPRKPIDPNMALGYVLLGAAVIVAMVIWWQP